MTKHIALLGVIAALVLSGCGRGAATQVARPIPLGTSTKPALTSPALTQAKTAATPTPAPSVEEVAEDTPSDETEASTEPSTAPSALPSVLPSVIPSVLPSVTPTATPTAAPTATPTPAPTPVTVAANKFVKSIGNGSLNSANGLVASGDYVYVVDNARTGLFGKFAAVRQYEIASGSYTKLSLENLGMMGAKNMPTTVTAVKLDGENIVAGSPTTLYTFGLDGKLVSSEAGSLSLATQVTDPTTHDVFKVNGDHIDRVHAGTVIASFGDDVIGQAAAIAVGTDGSLFVSDKTKAVVHQFAPATK